MLRYIHEYRVNKKGADCFRSRSYEEARSKLEELQAKRPNVKFDLQTRSVPLDKYGVAIRDYKGRPMWSPWRSH